MSGLESNLKAPGDIISFIFAWFLLFFRHRMQGYKNVRGRSKFSAPEV
jgi:hypothetical protein